MLQDINPKIHSTKEWPSQSPDRNPVEMLCKQLMGGNPQHPRRWFLAKIPPNRHAGLINSYWTCLLTFISAQTKGSHTFATFSSIDK